MSDELKKTRPTRSLVGGYFGVKIHMQLTYAMRIETLTTMNRRAAIVDPGIPTSSFAENFARFRYRFVGATREKHFYYRPGRNPGLWYFETIKNPCGVGFGFLTRNTTGERRKSRCRSCEITDFNDALPSTARLASK